MGRRLFAPLCCLFAFVSLGRTVFAPLVEPLQPAFGVGPAAVGLTASLVWFGTAAARIPTGYLMTRIDRVRLIVGTGSLLTLAAVAAALTPTFPLLVLQAVAFVLGLSTGVYVVAAVPLVGDLFPDRVGFAVGVHGVAAQVAAVAAPIVVVTLVEAAAWPAVFWLLAAGAASSTALVAVASRRSTLPDASAPDRDFRGAFTHWRVLLAAVTLLTLAGFVWQGVFNFYVSFLVAEKSFDPSTANLALSVLFAAGIPAFVASGRLADRFPVVPYTLGIVGSYALAVVALTAVSGEVATFGVTVAIGYFIHSVFPALDTYVLGSIPDSHRASAYAVFSGSTFAVQSWGSAVTGTLVESAYEFGTVFRWYGVAILPVVALLVVVYVLGLFPATDRPFRAASGDD